MSKGKVLVTGANGFLGANVVAQLLESDYEVAAYIRKGCNKMSINDLDCELIEGDLSNISKVEMAVKGCDYVIHCAARTTQSPIHLNAYKEANIYATAILIEVCKKLHIKRFVFVSTANCFTNGSLANPGTEESGFMPWLKRSGYAFSKYIAQQIALNEHHKNGFPAIVVAPTFLIGPRDAKPSSGRMILYAIKNKYAFVPPGGKSFVDVENVAGSIVNSLTMGKTGECYLLSGVNLKTKEFLKQVNPNGFYLTIPRWLLVIMAFITNIVNRLLHLSLPLTRTNQRLLCLDNYFSNQKAVNELKMKETILPVAICKAANWFEENKFFNLDV